MKKFILTIIFVLFVFVGISFADDLKTSDSGVKHILKQLQTSNIDHFLFSTLQETSKHIKFVKYNNSKKLPVIEYHIYRSIGKISQGDIDLFFAGFGTFIFENEHLVPLIKNKNTIVHAIFLNNKVTNHSWQNRGSIFITWKRK